MVTVRIVNCFAVARKKEKANIFGIVGIVE